MSRPFVKVEYQGHSLKKKEKKMAVAGAFVYHKHDFLFNLLYCDVVFGIMCHRNTWNHLYVRAWHLQSLSS